jgi:hypothetical protein
MGILTESKNTATVLDHCFNGFYYQIQAYLQIRAVNITLTVVFSI